MNLVCSDDNPILPRPCSVRETYGMRRRGFPDGKCAIQGRDGLQQDPIEDLRTVCSSTVLSTMRIGTRESIDGAT